VYDHEIAGDHAWFRFTLMCTDPSTGETRTRASMQLYRIEAGKLAETWLTLLKLGSAWPMLLGRSTGRATELNDVRASSGFPCIKQLPTAIF
jgi:hypothetical protein